MAMRNPLMVGILAGIGGIVAAHAQNTIPANVPQVAVSAGQSFEIGDKLNLMFYERVEDVETSKWNKSSSTGFQQRPELSGEYTIDDTGAVSFPLLGSFPVVNHTIQSLQAELATAFEKTLGRKGFVTIMSLERPPVYVLGPVKTPGSFKYVPGMTVYHAIALAGGFAKQTVEPWQQIEAVSEGSKRRNSLESISDALVRVAVLKAERDHVDVRPPSRLIELVGETEARRLLAIETERRAAITNLHANREHAAAATVAAARQEFQTLSNRRQPLDNVIKLRQDRVNAIRKLMETGNANRNFLAQAEADLADAEARKQESVNQVELAKQRATLLEQDQAKVEADIRAEIDNGIQTIEQQIAASERDTKSSEGILGALRATDVGFVPPSAPSQFEIVRQTATGPVAIPAQGMTMLRPGDLVRISVESSPPPQPSVQPKEREAVNPSVEPKPANSVQPAPVQPAPVQPTQSSVRPAPKHKVMGYKGRFHEQYLRPQMLAFGPATLSPPRE